MSNDSDENVCYNIHHSFTLSLQAQNLPFQQILPTLDFFYLPECLHDNVRVGVKCEVRVCEVVKCEVQCEVGCDWSVASGSPRTLLNGN